MVDYAAEIEVRSDGEAKSEEITNYDEVQDNLWGLVPPQVCGSRAIYSRRRTLELQYWMF